MKKKKILSVILIVQAVALIGLIVGIVLLWPSVWKLEDLETMPSTLINGTEADAYSGYADVTLYGAVADDGEDDTEAFINAAKTGANVYVPLGTFDIEDTLTLRGQNLKGGGIDRTVIRFNGEGAIVKMKGAATVDDITLTFADGLVSGDETEGQQVAIYDDGITNGAMLRAVKLTNVGTGYYSPAKADANVSFTAESLVVDKFSYKAIQIKDASATVIRATNIGETVGDVDAAVSISGSFTLEAFTFSGTKCNYPLELNTCKSAVMNSIIFDSVKAESGCFIKSVSSVISMKTVTVKNSAATALVNIEDTKDGGETIGNVISLWSDSGALVTDAENKIKCDSNISQ